MHQCIKAEQFDVEIQSKSKNRTQRFAEYQEQTIQTRKDIASDFIEAEKQVIALFNHK